MYDIKDIRRENMRALARLVGGITYLANKLCKSQSQISQLIGKSPSKNIGDKIARQIENVFGKPRGWMDVLHNDVDETITAYELIKNTAPHRPIPIINWEELPNETSASLKDIVQHIEPEQLIAGNAKLSEHSFAIRVDEINRERCAYPFHSPKQTYLAIDPYKEIQGESLVVIPSDDGKGLALREAYTDGKRYYIRTRPNESQAEPLPSDSNFGVVRQIIVELD